MNLDENNEDLRESVPDTICYGECVSENNLEIWREWIAMKVPIVIDSYTSAPDISSFRERHGLGYMMPRNRDFME